MAYDRYNRFRTDGTIKIPVMVEIPKKSTDYYETYRRGYTRFDLLSYDYYGDPNYDWVILMANPSLGSMEFEFPDGAEIRIPYPLNKTLEQYNKNLDRYDLLYGLNKKAE